MSDLNVTTDDGKYTVVMKNDKMNGRLHALRHGAYWRDLTGDQLVLTLAQDLQRTREELNELKNEFIARLKMETQR